MRTRGWVAAVVLALAAPAAAGPESLEWRRYESPNFTAYSTAPQLRTLDYIVRLERFRDALGMIFSNLEVASPVDTTVFVFHNKAAMEPFVPRYNGKPVEIAGMFAARRDANFVLIDASGSHDRMPVVYHEYMHSFTKRNLPPLPPWFGEGIAQCYETFRIEGKTAVLGKAKLELIDYLKQSPFMPLEQLLAVRYDSPEYNEGDRRGVFYAESWALVHFLFWDASQYRPKVVKFLESLGGGQDQRAAFTAAFGIEPAALEAEFRRHLERGVYMESVVPLQAREIGTTPQRGPAGKADILSRLGDLTAHIAPERPEQSEQLLTAALEAEPGNAVALRALAIVRKDHGKSGEAKALLEKRLAADPGDAMAAWSLAALLLGDEDTIPRARSLLSAAAGARPQTPEIAVDYGRSLLSGPPEPSPVDLDGAIGLLDTARKKLRYRADIVSTEAVLLAARGNFPSADALVTRALTGLGDPKELAWARESIDRFRRSQTANGGKQAAAGGPGVPPPPDGTGAGPPPPKDTSQDRTQAYNRDVDTFNKAVLLANQRDYAGALALLEPLYEKTAFSDIKDRVLPLLTDLRQRAPRK